MNEPNDTEINRKIAEYEFDYKTKKTGEYQVFATNGKRYGLPRSYTTSLDLQIPAWGKLTVTNIKLSPRIGDEGDSSYVEIETFATDKFLAFADPISRAGALALLKAITEIEK